MKPEQQQSLVSLRAAIDAYAGRFTKLNGAADLAEYLAAPLDRDDEELLTEPVLGEMLERVLGFPKDAYFPQFSRSGLKPDFTPIDLVAHRFVLDAKSSAHKDLDAHEPQIRAYIDQRRLDFGILFNLREVRVYRRGESGHVADLSFPVQPLWEVAAGAALPGDELARFDRFRATFAHRTLGLDDKIALIRKAKPWKEIDGSAGPTIDIDYLVERLRALSVQLSDDASSQQAELDRFLKLNPGRADALVAELRTLALELDPGTDTDALPGTVAGFRGAGGLPGRAWRQYLMRVSQLALIRILLHRSWEDAGFVDERLYDGGFGRLYERLGHRVRDVLDVWFAVRGKVPWHVRRDYEPKHMQRMPCRHVVAAEQAGVAADLLTAASAALTAGEDDAVLARAVEALVRCVVRNRQRLLDLRDDAPLLARAVKDPWFTDVVPVAPAAALAQLPSSQRRSLRVDPAITVTSDAAPEQRLGKVVRVPGAIRFRHGRSTTATVAADETRLDVLEQVLGAGTPVLLEQLRAVELPADPDAFLSDMAAQEAGIAALLVEGRDLVETVERLVCRIHGVPGDLADELVLHAQERARQRMATS